MREDCHHLMPGKQRTSWPTLETPAVRERNPEVLNLVIVPLRGDLVMAGYTRPRGGSKPKSNMRAFRKANTLVGKTEIVSPRAIAAQRAAIQALPFPSPTGAPRAIPAVLIIRISSTPRCAPISNSTMSRSHLRSHWLSEDCSGLDCAGARRADGLPAAKGAL